MSLTIVTALDGKDMAHTLAQSTNQFCDSVIKSLDEVVCGTHTTTQSVFVLILTPLMCKDIIKGKTNAIETLLDNDVVNLIVLNACQKEQLSVTKNLLKTNKSKDLTLNQYDVMDQDQWLIAETKIKGLVQKLQDRIYVPKVNKFVIKPERISQIQSEVLVILVDDNHTAERVIVQVDTNIASINTRKVGAGIWSFDAKDLSPGEHTLSVCVDNNDIGRTNLIVQSRFDAMTFVLKNVIQHQPEEFMVKAMGLTEGSGNFDRDLFDMLENSLSNGLYPFFKVVGCLLQFTDKRDEHTFPTFVHFCAKYGLQNTCQWILDKTADGETASKILNRDVENPLMMAQPSEPAHSLQILERLSPDVEEEFECVTSPLEKSGHYTFSGDQVTENAVTNGNKQRNSAKKVFIEHKHMSLKRGEHVIKRRSKVRDTDSGHSSSGSLNTTSSSESLKDNDSINNIASSECFDNKSNDSLNDQQPDAVQAFRHSTKKMERYNSNRLTFMEINERHKNKSTSSSLDLTREKRDALHVNKETEGNGDASSTVTLRTKEREDPYNLPWEATPLPIGAMPMSNKSKTLPRNMIRSTNL